VRPSRSALCLLGLVLLATRASADEPTIIRFGTVAPEGSSWAREGLAFARDVEQRTDGRVKVKVYFGGITGDEVQTIAQARRGRIDAIASGGMSCLALAPSLRVFRVPGLIGSRAEASYVNGRLQRAVDKEFLASGFINLGELSIGPDMFFTKAPVRAMSDLQQQSLWVWDLDPVLSVALPAMGLRPVPVALPNALHAFEAGRVSGFVAVPTAALAFQWSTQARYLSDLHLGILRGCVIITTRAFDALSADDQDALRAAGSKAVARLEEVGRESDEALLDGLFAKQGVTTVKATDSFRAELFAAETVARDRIPESVVPHSLIVRVLGMLADFRAQASPRRRDRLNAVSSR
jgi:TRAP-type transport system periplasmic protein